MPRFSAIFLDRDGVINRKPPEGDYVKRWSEFEFLPGALEAIRLLGTLAGRLIVVTNQRGVALGRMREDDVREIHHRMLAAIREAGGRLDAIYYCPHEEAACQCRKPALGMFLRAKQDFPDIEFAESLVIGDSLRDLEAASRLGCAAVLIAEGQRRAELLAQAQRRSLPDPQTAVSLPDFGSELMKCRVQMRAHHPPAPP